MNKRFIWGLVVGVLLVATALIVFGVHQSERTMFHLLRETSGKIAHAHQRSLVGTAVVYFILYVVNGAFSLPFGGLLTAAAGAIFGFWWGLALSAVAASVGAVAGLLVSRYLFHGLIERHFGARLAPIHKGLAEEGAFYLFALRMVPVFPYWLLNLLMGLTSMRVFTFWWVSTLGLLPLEALYVFAGTQLATVNELGLSPKLIGALVALGVFPLLLKRLIGWAEKRFFRHEA